MSLVDATMKLLRDLRHGLESDVARSVCNTHPLSPAYRESLSVTLRARADQLWLDLCGVFVGLEAEAALRQAWSISPDSPLWTGLLYSAATRESDTMRKEARRLLELCPGLLQAGIRILSRNSHAVDSLGYWLLANEPKGAPAPIPDFGVVTSVRPQWRLRFRLASAVARGEGLAHLFRRAAAQPAVSDSARRVEFLKAMHASRAKSGHTSRLTPLTIVMFDERELRLLHLMAPYWSEFVSPSLARMRAPLAGLDALLLRREQLVNTFTAVDQALNRRDFSAVNTFLAGLPDDPLINAVARHYFMLRDFSEMDLWAHPAIDPDWGPWQPLTAASHQRIGMWRQKALPAVWAMTPCEVQRAILQKRLRPDERRHGMFAQDIAAIRRGWSDEEKVALIRSGAGTFIDWKEAAWDHLSLGEFARVLRAHPPGPLGRLKARLRALPDARPWLAVMAQGDAHDLRNLAEYCLRMNLGPSVPKDLWGRFCASAVGTPEWQAVRDEATREQPLVMQAVVLLEGGVKPVDAPAMREAIAIALHEPGQRVRQIASHCLRWVALDPDALETLVRLAPRDLIRAIERNRQTPTAIRARIRGFVKLHSPEKPTLRRSRYDDRQVPLL